MLKYLVLLSSSTQLLNFLTKNTKTAETKEENSKSPSNHPTNRANMRSKFGTSLNDLVQGNKSFTNMSSDSSRCDESQGELLLSEKDVLSNVSVDPVHDGSGISVEVEEITNLSDPVGSGRVAIEFSTKTDGDVHTEEDGDHEGDFGETEVDSVAVAGAAVDDGLTNSGGTIFRFLGEVVNSSVEISSRDLFLGGHFFFFC